MVIYNEKYYYSQVIREGYAKIFTVNVLKGFILDNTPFANLLGANFDRMGYKKLGDLYIPTCISLVNQTSGTDTRIWSNDPKYKDLDLLEVVLASTGKSISFHVKNFKFNFC